MAGLEVAHAGGEVAVGALDRVTEQDLANVGSGCVDAVAAVATEVGAGRSVVFVEGAARRQPRSSDAVGYVASWLAVEHLMASSAIPMLLPPVWVRRPHGGRGWYLDGAIRLHQPIKPCLDVGAER